MHEGHWVSYFTVSWMTRDMGGAADERMTVLIIFLPRLSYWISAVVACADAKREQHWEI